MSPEPQLVLLAHGSREPEGPALIESIAEGVRRRLPDTSVHVGYADVCGPTLADVLDEVSGPAVVVPAFLAAGYHVRVDVPAQLTEIGRADVVLAQSLGPDGGLVTAAYDRLREIGWKPGDAAVLAAAGSTDARAVSDVYRAASALSTMVGQRVPVGFIASGEPRVCDLVGALRTADRAVFVSTWLLAPGQFHQRLLTSGADAVAAPLGTHDAVLDTIALRYRAASLRVRRAAA